jgi:C4-dicarboxylate transporter DctM subunit
LVKFASSLVGRVYGGLAIVAIIACTFFGALSGSGPATLAAIGSIMIPYMLEEGYDRAFTTALIATAACIGLFIPPSIAMVTYGVTTGQSIGDLFVAGIGPGILTAVALSVVSYFYSKKHGYIGKEKFSVKNVLRNLKHAVLPLMMPVIILGGIYGGIFTPTEAAAVSVFYALLVGLVLTRELKMSEIPKILQESAVTSGMVMFLVAMASAFGRILTMKRLPAHLVNAVTEMDLSPIMFLLILNLAMLVIGTFMELNATLLILGAILAPVAKALNIDLVHFGVIMVVNMTFGLITPPLGIHLFLGCGISGIKFDELLPKIWPFIFTAIGIILLVTYFPPISMFLVGVMRG